MCCTCIWHMHVTAAHMQYSFTLSVQALNGHAGLQNADLSDVLFDRAVLNGANLKNANLSRTIFTRYVCGPPAVNLFCNSHKRTCHMFAASFRTDFGGAIITGADFTNALVDKSQQIVSVQKRHAYP